LTTLQLTGADFAMIYPLLSYNISSYPAIRAYLDKLRGRPAWQSAEKKTEVPDLLVSLSQR
jgi:glutathione S-transferase